MLQLTLTRDTRHPLCTVGTLLIAGRKLHTIERPWLPDSLCKSGVKYRSCVAAGLYRVERHHSERYPNSFALVNPSLDVYHLPDDVPKGRQDSTRTAILIHAGNYWHDVIGCIAPGKDRTKTPDAWMVTRSRDAMNEIRTLIGGRADVTLEIRYAATEGGV